MNPPPESTPRGATFYVACGVLVAAAVAQVSLGLWWWQKQLATRELALQAEVKPVVDLPVVVPSPLKPLPPVVAESHLEPSPSAISPPLRRAEKKSSFGPTLDVPIVDEEIIELLEAGLNARQKNDMQAALEAFRAAWLKQPDHPKLIYQLAHTLDLMGLESKAQTHWNTLVNLGRAAGDFFRLAEMRVKQKGIVAPTLAELEEREGKLAITDATLQSVRGVYGGQKKLLSFTIKKNTAEIVSSETIGAGIHFFDLVNGSRIDRTTARPPAARKVSAPEDWAERGLERWEVLYDQAEMTPTEIVKFGQRKFYGYVLQLYLADPNKPDDLGRLQDVLAEPAELESFAREMPVEPAAPPSNAADSSLFPH